MTFCLASLGAARLLREEPLTRHLDGVVVDDGRPRVEDVLHPELLLALPVHVRVGPVALTAEQLDQLED